MKRFRIQFTRTVTYQCDARIAAQEVEDAAFEFNLETCQPRHPKAGRNLHVEISQDTLEITSAHEEETQ